MSANPRVDSLELRAMQQRNQLHQTVTELKQKVSDVREKLDIKKNLRRHKMSVLLVGAGILVLLGVAFARSFDR